MVAAGASPFEGAAASLGSSLEVLLKNWLSLAWIDWDAEKARRRRKRRGSCFTKVAIWSGDDDAGGRDTNTYIDDADDDTVWCYGCN